MRNSTQSRLGDLGRHKSPVFATCALVLILPFVFGWAHGWMPSLCLLVLALSSWLLDPVVVVIAFGASALLAAGASRWMPPLGSGWAPQPLAMWITIAGILFVRMELRVRRNLSSSRTELQAQKREQVEWRAFFDDSPAAIVIADGEGRILLGNPAARKLFGYEDRPISGVGIAQSIAALGAALRIDREKTLFHNLTGCTGWRPNGEMFVADAWFSIGETPFGTRLGAVIVDASERLQDRARGGLRSSMATSQIAMGAVLHEIRNLSSAAALMYNNLGHVSTGQAPALEKNPDFEALGTLLKALAGLASAELRPGEGSYSSVNLVEVLSQLRIIVDPWFVESEMTIDWSVASDLPEVWGEESGLLQLFMNLAQNSNRAMLSSDEKKLTIAARVEQEWVTVRFSDTGPGIANPEQLFEPFRRSTGIKRLGLFVSRAIAKSFHGELRYTPVESGSCFTVELLPLREWQKVTGDSGKAPPPH